MRLVRYGEAGSEKPGILDSSGAIRDLSGVVKDIDGSTITPEGLNKLRGVDVNALPKVSGNPRYGAPVGSIGKFIAIGLNYADHAKESNLPIPKEPVVFMKATSCICGPNDTVVLPKGSVKGDWEVELAFAIGKTAKNVTEAEALDYVAGYMICNDVSEREWQLERGPTWDKGKGFDTFGPIGPWLVTSDEIRDPQNLAMWLDVNGQRMQTGNTKTMIFDIAKLVSYVSFLFTLKPGDVITTGTPPGVGMGIKPNAVFLKSGDVMRVGIDGLGEQRQQVTAG
ncbi:MAG: fumarylacetoacetate hydrolase family protein [Burkholderiales bacterium]|nr:fumarylacetoacetate hydrolase family protein [Burkholderiales bacterium]MCW5622404.1 fumarylacetoacetate hydrolase family protein [Burkholderiales bacterium]